MSQCLICLTMKQNANSISYYPICAYNKQYLDSISKKLGRRRKREVAGRFPRDAITAHRLARGQAQRPPVRRALPPDLAITESFEHPLEREVAAGTAGAVAAMRRVRSGVSSHGN
jgi:hypothetical protein